MNVGKTITRIMVIAACATLGGTLGAQNTWTEPAQLNQYPGPDSDLLQLKDVDVSIDSGENGVMLAVWFALRTHAGGENATLMAARSTDSGETWGPPVPILIPPQSESGFSLRHLEINYAGQNRWTAWWTIASNFGYGAQFFSVSYDNGDTWEPERIYSGSTPTPGRNGTILGVTSYTPTPTTRQYAVLRYLLDTQESEATFRLPFSERFHSFVYTGGSNWLVLTTDGLPDSQFTAIYASTDDGVTLSKTNDGTETPPKTANFASDGSGSVMAIYHLPDAAATTLFSSFTTDNGQTWSEPSHISDVSYGLITKHSRDTESRLGKVVHAGGSRWTAAWMTDAHDGIPAQIHSSISENNGQTWSAAQVITDLSALVPYYSTHRFPALAADGTNSIIAWPFDTNAADSSSPDVDLFYRVNSPLAPPPPPPPPPPPGEVDARKNVEAVWAPIFAGCKPGKKGATKCQLKTTLVAANTGSAKLTAKSWTKVYLSDDPILDDLDVQIKSTKFGKLKAGKGKNTKLKLKTVAPLTGKYLIAVLDADYQVSESNENDNIIVSDPLP